MTLAHHDPSDGILITRIGHAEITVRPEPAASPDGRAVVLIRIEAPMLDALSAAYLDPAEAILVADALRHAAEQAGRP
jgi:hypothetical protein